MPAKIPRFFSRIEVGSTALSEAGTATITFSPAFDRAPVVILSEKDTSNDANHKLNITALSKASFSVAASNPEAGTYVEWQAIG